ncbi:MAG: hypothetical protein ACJ71T_13370 [Actinomycetales bacterium]
MSTDGPRIPDRATDHTADDRIDDLMTTADAELLDHLQVMWEKADPVPSGLVERVTFAIGLDNLEFELMRLTEEVLVPAGARGAEHVRTITFGGESITVMVTVSQEGHGQFRLDGWLAPAAALSIELRRSEGSVRTTSDEGGRFVFDDVPGGLAQLVLHPTPNSAVELRQDVVAPAVQI